MHVLAIWCLATTAALIYCAGTATAASDLPPARIAAIGFENRGWTVERSYDGASLVPPTAVSRMTFTNGRIEGTPGCGFLFASYTLSGAHLTIASFGFFLGGYCPDDILSQSKSITKALSGELTIERDGQRVVLRDAQGTIQVILRP